MSDTEKTNVVKVTLATGKIVLLQEMKLKFEDLAIQAVGDKAGKNELLSGKMMQDELMKILIVEIDGERPKAVDREDLSKLLTYTEITSLRKVMQKMMGDGGDPKLETVSYSGGK